MRKTTLKVKESKSRNNMPFPCDVFIKLSGDSNWTVRQDLASNMKLPPACAIFTVLSKDNQRFVRETVARNPSIPNQCVEDIITRLSRDDEEIVKRAVSKRYLKTKII